MPLYEYQCPKCKKTYTVHQEFEDEHIYKCCKKTFCQKWTPKGFWFDYDFKSDKVDIATGKRYKSAKDRDNDYAKNNLRRIK